MGRQNHKHLVLKCNKGINQQADLADPDECADALNVWAPNGAIEQRPGFSGYDSMFVAGDAIETQSQEVHVLSALGVYSSAAEGAKVALDDHPVGGHWFLGFSEITDLGSDDDRAQLLSFKGAFDGTKNNANATWMRADYWNGTEWKYIRVSERLSTTKSSKHLDSAGTSAYALSFVSPADWASSVINSRTAYYLRFTIQDNALDDEVEINNAAGSLQSVSPVHDVTRGLFVAQFKTKKRYFYLLNPSAGLRAVLGSTLDMEDYSNSGTETRVVADELASIAVVPQFDEAFVAYGGMVTRFEAAEGLSSTVGANVAKVEDADFAVGEGARFDPTFIALLAEWPRARFITFYNGMLWCAGIDGEQFTVKWSASAPFHRVWSALSFSVLMEDDNSPITGLSALGENVVVFKSDSVWIMVNVGENPATGLDDFQPIRVVAGVGCVSNASIQRIRGGLIFLAEDGVYRFDGTPNIVKLSDRIGKTIESISPSRRNLAASVHWRTKSCYLLSVAVDGSHDNNRTIVYDYKNDAFWLWDVPAKLWLLDEDAHDNERLYFINQYAQVFEMGAGNHDHGAAISSNILTQRIGENLNTKITIRQVEVLSDNRTSSLSVAVRHNDDENSETTGTLDLTDSTEATYGTAVDGVDKYVQDRRRPRRLSYRKQGDWLQVKISHSTKNTPMTIAGIDVGYVPGGRR